MLVALRTIVLLSVILLFSKVVGDLRIDPLVRIDQGLVRGVKASDGLYSYFLGIPYAQVDLINPFGTALPPQNFGEKIFDANDGSVICPQLDLKPGLAPRVGRYREILDCLRLNIYVPFEASHKNLLPVLFWIHGGEFEYGFGIQYHPKDLVNQRVIVVTINYRLGPYGFMCLDSPLVPGNQGLKDQYQALKWIKNNIAYFGGNPNEITVGGQGAGSCSTLLHLYSSKDKLYKRIIAQSGTPLSEGMFIESDHKAAIKLAEYLDFNTTDTEQAIQFLARTPLEWVIKAATELSLIFKPCKEKSFSGVDNFIENYPFSLSNRNKVEDTPIIIGHLLNEFVRFTFAIDDYYDKNLFSKKIKNNFNLTDEQAEEAVTFVQHYYLGDRKVTPDDIAKFNMSLFESDFTYHYPVQRTINDLIHENAGPVYRYIITSQSVHTAELQYLFEMTHPIYDCNLVDSNVCKYQDQKGMAKIMTTMWANFAKYGNPTPKVTEDVREIWEPFSSEIKRQCLLISDNPQMHGCYLTSNVAFWELFFYRYEKYHRLVKECIIN